ncbi:MAG: arylsulfatase [Singulisphaera sp.]
MPPTRLLATLVPHPKKSWLLPCLVACLTFPVHAIAGRTLAAPPNIVFILADDLGYGDLGCYNRESKIPTPHLDRLAGEGLRFTDAHSPSSVCSPTRYALLTGRYAWRSRLQQGVLVPWDPPLVARDRLTVAALLQQHGYRTACIGKWHLGWEWPTTDGQRAESVKNRLSNVDFSKPLTGGPTTRGFDRYFGTDVPNYPPYCFIEQDRTLGIPHAANRPEFNRPGPMLPGWQWVDIMPELTARAVHFIHDAAHDDQRRPFFLYMPLTAPHYPVTPAARFQGRSQCGDYGDLVAQVDDTVGQVVAALAAAQVAANTLVIFTSDNGPEIAGEVRPGAYDRARTYGHYSMAPWRGTKRDLWEGGHRVPFLVRWPGNVKPGTTSDETICHVDLLATVAAILGATLPSNAGEDSYNLLPVLRGESYSRPLREATVHHSGSGRFAIRKGDWVLIAGPGGDDNGPKTGSEPAWFRSERGYSQTEPQRQLYNLREDPHQRHNVAERQPQVVDELQSLLARYLNQGRSTPGDLQKNDVAIEGRRLP